jgi:tripartite-type tricarboxylate transporter receptor subunit TctC
MRYLPSKATRLLPRMAATLLLGGLLLPIGATAQAPYPAKPIRIVVPLPPGGSMDITFRIVSTRFQQIAGHGFVIENRTGASGILAAETVMRAPADGYTLLGASVSLMSINPHTFEKLPYDPVKDFVPITNVYRTNYFWVAGPSAPAANLKEYVAWAKTAPGKASFGSAGVGSISHLASAMFSQAAGIELLHVPYKGAIQSITDMLAGRVSAVFAPVIAFGDHLKTGNLRVLAAATDRRVASFPDVPTFTEQGFDVIAPLWTGLVAPAGTPAPVIDTLNRHLVQALAAADVRDQLAKVDQETIGGTPAQFAQFMLTDRERWGKAVKASGFKSTN